MPLPLPRASPSACCIPALGGDGKALDREQGLGSRDVFCAATFLIAVKSLNPPRLLGVLCTSPWAWARWCQQRVTAAGLVGLSYLEKCVLAAATIPSPPTLGRLHQ